MTANESMLRAALALAGDALFVIDVESMQYIEFNDATCRITGLAREELTRLGPLGVWMQTGGSAEGLREHYDTLIAQSPASMHHVTVVHRPDGSFVRVGMNRRALRIEGRWVVVAAARDFVANHDAPTMAASNPETSPSIDSLRAALEASKDAVTIIDYQGMRYIDVNAGACELLGFTREEMLEGDLPLTGARTLEDLRQVYSGLILQSPQPATEIIVFSRSDGSTVRGEVTRQAILADGMFVIYVVVKVLPALNPSA
jgi:PAS domain S-box-containing protein